MVVVVVAAAEAAPAPRLKPPVLAAGGCAVGVVPNENPPVAAGAC